MTALIYLIARGGGMRDRALKAQADAKKHMDAYIQQQAHSSPADELHKLNDLKEKGAISGEEFEKAKDETARLDDGDQATPDQVDSRPGGRPRSLSGGRGGPSRRSAPRPWPASHPARRSSPAAAPRPART